MKTNRPLTPSGQEKSICSIKLTPYKYTKSHFRLCSSKPIIILPLSPCNIKQLLYWNLIFGVGFCNRTYNIIILHSVVLWSTQSVGCSCTVCTGCERLTVGVWCSWRLWRRLGDFLKAADCAAYFSNIIMHNTPLFFSSKTSQGRHHKMFTLHKIFILTSHLVSYWLS